MTESYTKFRRVGVDGQAPSPAARKEAADEVRETMLFQGRKLLRWTLRSTFSREELADSIGDWKRALAEGEYFRAVAERPDSEIDIEEFIKTGAPDRTKP